MGNKMNIRSIIIIAIIGIITMFCLHISLAASTGKINVETANLREKPDENSKILEQFSVNQEVEILEKTGQWYKVKIQGITGYLRQDLVTADGEIKQEEENEIQVSNTVNENEQEPVENNIQKEENSQEKEKIELGKNKIAEDTKLKILPIINATDIMEIKKDEEINVVEIINGWACIEVKETKGWIREDKVKKEEAQEPVQNEEQEQQPETEKTEETEEPKVEQPKQQEQQEQQEPKVETKNVTKTLFVNASSVNLRSQASTSSEVITTLPMNTAVEVISEENGWSKVKVSGKEGYISTALLSSERQSTSRSLETARSENNNKEEEKTTTEQDTNSAKKGNNIVETAKKYIGSKYIYGGTTPSGFDCSGFTSYVYKLHGISLNRTAAGQYSNGTAVDRKDLQPGDLVMFGKSGINHVGIYIGGGNMIHAANGSRGVTIDTINSGYYNNNYVGARRII